MGVMQGRDSVTTRSIPFPIGSSTRPHKGGFVWCYGGFDCMCYRRSRVSGRMTSSMVPFIRRALVPAATFRFKCDERPKCRLTVSSQSPRGWATRGAGGVCGAASRVNNSPGAGKLKSPPTETKISLARLRALERSLCNDSARRLACFTEGQ